MNQDEILFGWLNSKQTHNFYRLVEPKSVSNEFKAIPGGRSNYGFLKFQCEPADELSFQRIANWPDSLPPDYQKSLDIAVNEGIAESLFMGLYPHIGCLLQCVDIVWNEIESNEWAFYRAALGAMEELKSTGQWKIVINSKRSMQK